MNLALFDFDGTITFNDTFTAFIHYALDPGRLAAGKLILSPLIIGYKLGLVPARIIRPCISWFGFKGALEADVRKIGISYARDILDQCVRPAAMSRIRWHKQNGDRVVIVSASLDVYLSEWCRQLGLELICTRLETDGGILTGRYLNGDCSGRQKAEQVLETYNLQEFSMIYAYGDTEEDREMLDLAHEKYFRWRAVV